MTSNAMVSRVKFVFMREKCFFVYDLYIEIVCLDACTLVKSGVRAACVKMTIPIIVTFLLLLLVHQRGALADLQFREIHALFSKTTTGMRARLKTVVYFKQKETEVTKR